MSRIELIPEDYFPGVDGSPTVDVCRECENEFEEGEVQNLTHPFGSIVSEKNIPHPPYHEDEYECAVCGEELGEADE